MSETVGVHINLDSILLQVQCLKGRVIPLSKDERRKLKTLKGLIDNLLGE